MKKLSKRNEVVENTVATFDACYDQCNETCNGVWVANTAIYHCIHS